MSIWKILSQLPQKYTHSHIYCTLVTEAKNPSTDKWVNNTLYIKKYFRNKKKSHDISRKKKNETGDYFVKRNKQDSLR